MSFAAPPTWMPGQPCRLVSPVRRCRGGGGDRCEARDSPLPTPGLIAPGQGNLVGLQSPVCRHKGEAFDPRLADQEPVDGTIEKVYSSMNLARMSG